MDGKIRWVTVFSPNDISGQRRPKNIKFGTKVVCSMKMMLALRFLVKSFKLWQQNLQKYPKIGQKTPIKQKHSHGGATYMHKQLIQYIVPPCEWILHSISDSTKH